MRGGPDPGTGEGAKKPGAGGLRPVAAAAGQVGGEGAPRPPPVSASAEPRGRSRRRPPRGAGGGGGGKCAAEAGVPGGWGSAPPGPARPGAAAASGRDEQRAPGSTWNGAPVAGREGRDAQRCPRLPGLLGSALRCWQLCPSCASSGDSLTFLLL